MKRREIEFRVRDGRTRKVLGYEYFNTCLNSGFYYINLSELKEGEDEGDLICHSNYSDEPMLMPTGLGQLIREEYTGLKDKNGTKIYEGDMFEPDETNEEVKSVVSWDEYNAKFVVDSYGYEMHIGEGSQEVYNSDLSICDTVDLCDIILDRCEVIGNIHEKK